MPGLPLWTLDCSSPGHGDGEPRDESHHLLSVRGRDRPTVPCHHFSAGIPGDSTCGQRTSNSSGGKDPCKGERDPAVFHFFRESQYSDSIQEGSPTSDLAESPDHGKGAKPIYCVEGGEQPPWEPHRSRVKADTEWDGRHLPGP